MARFCSKHLHLNSSPSRLFRGTGVIPKNVIHLFQAPALRLRDEEKRPD